MSEQLTVVESGPMRVIGMSRIGTGQNNQFSQLWETVLTPRYDEIVRPADGVAVGICRCVPGATDGSFEYIAAFEATPNAEVPAGMIEVRLPRCQYAIFPVANLAEIGTRWSHVQAEMGAHTGPI